MKIAYDLKALRPTISGSKPAIGVDGAPSGPGQKGAISTAKVSGLTPSKGVDFVSAWKSTKGLP